MTELNKWKHNCVITLQIMLADDKLDFSPTSLTNKLFSFAFLQEQSIDVT